MVKPARWQSMKRRSGVVWAGRSGRHAWRGTSHRVSWRKRSTRTPKRSAALNVAQRCRHSCACSPLLRRSTSPWPRSLGWRALVRWMSGKSYRALSPACHHKIANWPPRSCGRSCKRERRDLQIASGDIGDIGDVARGSAQVDALNNMGVDDQGAADMGFLPDVPHVPQRHPGSGCHRDSLRTPLRSRGAGVYG